MDECIEKRQKAPPSAPLHPWEWPESLWSRIHVDYSGPFVGEMFLLIVDAHRDCDRASVCSACQKCWYPTMEHVSQVLNLRHS